MFSDRDATELNFPHMDYINISCQYPHYTFITNSDRLSGIKMTLINNEPTAAISRKDFLLWVIALTG